MVKIDKMSQWGLFEKSKGSVQVVHKDFQICMPLVPTQDDDLFCSFRGLLILGRILGVIPISGVFKKSHKDLYFSSSSIAAIASICCIVLLALNAILAIGNVMWDQKGNALGIASSLGSIIFTSWGLFIYVYFLVRGKEFLQIFNFWFGISSNIHYSEKDTYLHRFVVVVSTLLFTSAVLENALLHMEYFDVFDDINGHTVRYGKETTNISTVQIYQRRANNHWNNIMGDHPMFALIAFLVHKWILYSWNYIDVLIALMCRALYFKFKALCRTENILFHPKSPGSTDLNLLSEIGRQPWAWLKLAEDHERLCNLIDVMNRFFSPLIFFIYSINIYMICLMFIGVLNPKFIAHSLVHSIYAPWSFLHLILRIFLLTICAAKVHDYANNIRSVIQRCPVELYNGYIAKLEKRANSCQKLGLTGLDCFVVTKPFMLGILNVVFTIEIVLLQGSTTTTTY